MRRRDGQPPARIARHCYPLWSIAPAAPAAGAIFLPAVKTLVYTVAGKGRGGSPGDWRRERIAQILTRCGFSDWSFFWGRPAERYWTAIPRDHAGILLGNRPPLLVLEDDAELRDWRPNIVAPMGCGVAYLGGGRSGDGRGLTAAAAAGIRFERAYRYGYQAIDSDWMRIFGMWFSHAILWLDRDVMLDAAALFISRDEAIDTTLAREQWRWNVCCRRVPIFWQNDGHHWRDTWSYDYSWFTSAENRP